MAKTGICIAQCTCALHIDVFSVVSSGVCSSTHNVWHTLPFKPSNVTVSTIFFVGIAFFSSSGCATFSLCRHCSNLPFCSFQTVVPISSWIAVTASSNLTSSVSCSLTPSMNLYPACTLISFFRIRTPSQVLWPWLCTQSLTVNYSTHSNLNAFLGRTNFTFCTCGFHFMMC